MNDKRNNPELFVDNESYQWERTSISGAELRGLAAIPAGVEIYLKVPGSPDRQILDDMVVDLVAQSGPERFSTQATGSQAG